MLGLLFSVIAAATSAPVTISNCELDQTFGSGRTIMYCDLTNTGTVAIAEIHFKATTRDANRAIPWSKNDGWPRGRMEISGGLEPGETINQLMMLPETPPRAPVETLLVDLYEIKAFGANGEPVTSPPTP